MTTAVLPDEANAKSLPSRRAAFAGGMRAMLPNLVGLAPLGMAIGAAAAGNGLPTGAGWLASVLIYSASPQLAAIDLLAHGASTVLVVATVLLINARLLIYSSTLATRWRGTSRGFRVLAGYLIVDPSFVVGTEGYQKHQVSYAGHAHYLGGAVLLWVTWQVAIVAGSTVGAVLPAGLHLDFLVVLYLISLLVPKLTSAPVRAGVLVGAVAAVAGSLLPVHVGAFAGIVAGLAVALSYKEKVR